MGSAEILGRWRMVAEDGTRRDEHRWGAQPPAPPERRAACGVGGCRHER